MGNENEIKVEMAPVCENCNFLGSDHCPKCSSNSAISSLYQEYQHGKDRPARTKTLKAKYECNECDCTFTRGSLLLAHIIKHSDKLPFSCTACGKTFENKCKWLNHLESECSIDNTSLQSCHKLNSVASGQKQQSKSRAKKFKCSQCAKSFKSVGSKNEHERNVHNPMRQYICNECGKSFYKKFNLNIHMEIHSNTRPHGCDLCGKTFKTSQGLRMHMESHSNERRFMCEVCGKVFKTRAVLDSHTAIHTGENKYRCNVCGKAYRYRSSLFIHMRTHTGQRPHTCKICNASFMVKCHLTGHMRSHTGEHPFVCMFCSASFTRAISLKKHLNSHLKAGCNVNLDSAMYHAKLQAFVMPRTSFKPVSTQYSSPSIPKVTHFLQGNIFVNGNNEAPVQNISLETVELYVDQPSDEKELIIIKVSSVDETGLYLKSAIQTSPDDCHGKTIWHLGQPKECFRTRNEKQRNRKLLQTNTNVKREKAGEPPKISLSMNQNVCMDSNNGNGKVKDEEKDCINSHGLVVDQILKLEIGNDAVRNNPYRENDQVNISLVSSGVLARQHHPANTFGVKEEPDGTINIGKPFIEEASEYMEHQELLLQKCSFCDKAFKCKTFVEGEDVCQECKSEQVLQKRGNMQLENLVSQNIPEVIKADCITENVSNITCNSYRCDKCSKSFGFRSELRKHVKQHSTRYPHICNKCGESFQQEVFLLRHQCGVSVANNSSQIHLQLTNTPNQCEKALEYKCDLCGKIYPKKFILKVHYRKHTGERPFKCKMCSERFISATHRKIHMRSHTVEGIYGCQDCDKYFKKKSEVLQHICKDRVKQYNVQVASNKTQANESTKDVNQEIKFKNPAQVSNTDRDNTAEKVKQGKYISRSSSIKCKFCCRTFKYVSVLQAHERIHTGEKPFLCSVCNKAFSKKSNMKIHMRIHTGERPFLCDICGKYFSHKYTLEAHKRLHTKERPFSCNLCDKSFSHEGNKLVHMKRHLKEKTFKCDICPKAFVAKIGLECHRRIHTGEKPYPCDICNRSFRVRHHLTEHHRRHTGEKPYVCDICNMAFTRFGTRKAHMKKHMNDDIG